VRGGHVGARISVSGAAELAERSVQERDILRARLGVQVPLSRGELGMPEETLDPAGFCLARDQRSGSVSQGVSFRTRRPAAGATRLKRRRIAAASSRRPKREQKTSSSAEV